MTDISMLNFIEYAFGARILGKMRQVVQALEENKLVAVKSCHASGKTFTIARCGLAHVAMHEDGVCITTAPSWEQVERVIWSEIHSALEVSKVRFPKPLQTEMRIGPKNYIRGLSTDRGVRFQGYHGRILILIDEGAGVADDIWEAIEGIRAGGDVRVLTTGNPTLTSGRFYDAFQPGSPWAKITISAFDVPNFYCERRGRWLTIEDILAMDEDELNDNPYPFLANRWWVREKYEEWGPDSPIYASRVLGEFPDQSEDSLVGLRWIEQANQKVLYSGGRLAAGIDVAGPGEDETVLTIVERTPDGVKVLGQWGWPDQDPRGKIAANLALWGPKEAYEMVHVDAIGVGYHLATHLKDLGYAVHAANVAKTARDDTKFNRFKAEWYWNLRLLFQQQKIWGVTSEKTQGQLAAVRYLHNTRGQIEIESKDAMRKRGVRHSPDWAESLMLAAIPLLQVFSGIETVQRPSDVLDTLVVPSPHDWRW